MDSNWRVGWRCDGQGWTAAADRVVFDPSRSCIFGTHTAYSSMYVCCTLQMCIALHSGGADLLLTNGFVFRVYVAYLNYVLW
jgi:hypothetical protein